MINNMNLESLATLYHNAESYARLFIAKLSVDELKQLMKDMERVNQINCWCAVYGATQIWKDDVRSALGAKLREKVNEKTPG